MRFPDNWPENCPPEDADDAAGIVYRIVKNVPPLPEDLATHFETNRLRNAPACLRCGLSVFREVRDVVHQRLLLPKLGEFIASADLKPEHGKAKLTPGTQPTHTTWWAYEGVQRANLFVVMATEG